LLGETGPLAPQRACKSEGGGPKYGTFKIAVH
jgi:hypothetical protein